MPQGIETFDASGNLKFSATDRLTRILSIIVVSGNGSQYLEGLTTGTPFAYFQPYALGVNAGMPSFSYSGNTIFWTFPNGKPTSGFIVVGVY